MGYPKCENLYPNTIRGDNYSCKKCPTGYTRRQILGVNVDINGDEACIKDCPVDQFSYQFNNKCYKCENNYSPASVIITAPDNTIGACTRNENCESLNPGNYSNGLNGGFNDIGLSQCYSCPYGYDRTVFFSVLDDKACQKTCKAWDDGTKKNIHNDLLSNSCYYCPSDYPIKDGSKCKRTYDSSYNWTSGDYAYKCPSGYSKWGNTCRKNYTCSSKYSKSGYNTYAKDLTLDYCYACPQGFTRNLNSLTSNDSCTEGWKVWSTAKADLKTSYTTTNPISYQYKKDRIYLGEKGGYSGAYGPGAKTDKTIYQKNKTAIDMGDRTTSATISGYLPAIYNNYRYWKNTPNNTWLKCTGNGKGQGGIDVPNCNIYGMYKPEKTCMLKFPVANDSGEKTVSYFNPDIDLPDEYDIILEEKDMICNPLYTYTVEPISYDAKGDLSQPEEVPSFDYSSEGVNSNSDINSSEGINSNSDINSSEGVKIAGFNFSLLFMFIIFVFVVYLLGGFSFKTSNSKNTKQI